MKISEIKHKSESTTNKHEMSSNTQTIKLSQQRNRNTKRWLHIQQFTNLFRVHERPFSRCVSRVLSARRLAGVEIPRCPFGILGQTLMQHKSILTQRLNCTHLVPRQTPEGQVDRHREDVRRTKRNKSTEETFERGKCTEERKMHGKRAF